MGSLAYVTTVTYHYYFFFWASELFKPLPCSPWEGRWIGHWKTTWSRVCSSAPHSQAAEEAISHLYRQERKPPTPVRKRLSRTQALLGRVIPGAWVPVSGMKMRSLVGLSVHSAFPWWSAHCAARMLLLSDKLMNCECWVEQLYRLNGTTC